MSSSPLNQKNQGFDAAIDCRENDYLNRWAVAREIYGIATTGPSGWSVRVGIYGEWGTGKTSVLKMIELMASKEENIVISFDPWEYSTKAELWRAFVLTVFKHLETKLGAIKGAFEARQKALLERAKAVGVAVAGIFNEQAGKVLESGLELVKKHLSFSKEDLAALQETLGRRRVIILIDDLDRTAPELVPEILFALKELMNIPGFSFICAFDPIVVGEVLGKYHPGFGDGLKFLEKIIDYPRWLPLPSPENLARLALADSKHYCEYVPAQELQKAVSLLPQNPRAVRQFIRLIALLEPQIQRHREDELNWNIILTANVLKIRQPRIAHALLNSESFWDQISSMSLMSKEETDEEAKLNEAIKAHVESVAVTLGVPLSPTEKAEIISAMLELSKKVSWFRGVENFTYQMDLAEAPHAVTWKEFDAFFSAWNGDPTSKNVIDSVRAHSKRVERSRADVSVEILNAALQRYAEVLRQVDQVRTQTEIPALINEAQSLISLLECLVLEFGQISPPATRLPAKEIDQIFETLTVILKRSTPGIRDFCTRNETLLKNLIDRWAGDPTPLVDAVSPYGYYGSHRFEGEAAKALHGRLCSAVLPKLAAQVVNGFRQSDFFDLVWTQEKASLQARCILLKDPGPLWSGVRKEVLAVLKESSNNPVIQENVFELMLWFRHVLHERSGTGDANDLKKLLMDKELFDAIWGAATAAELTSVGTFQLNSLVLALNAIPVSVALPPWWESNLKEIALRHPEEIIQSEDG